MFRVLSRVLAATAALAFLTVAVASAQESTTTMEVKKFEVIAVEGNMLVVRLPEGTRQLTVPEDFRFTVDGQSLSVHDLKTGMKGTAAITTKTTVTPVIVTEVKNGTVMQPGGASVIVKSDAGIQMFTQGALDKRGVKIMRDGKEVDLSELHTGDQLTATIVTTKPPKVMTEKQVAASLAAPPAAEKPAASSSTAAPAATMTETPVKPKKLPKTASPLPLLGFGGFVLSLTGMALTALRRRLDR